MFLLTQDNLKIIELLANIQNDNEESTKINSQLIELQEKLDKIFNIPHTSISESEILEALKPIEDKTKKLIKKQDNYIEIIKLSIEVIQEILRFKYKFRENLTDCEIEALKIFEKALEELKANVLVLTPILIIKSLAPENSDFNWVKWLRDLHESLEYLLEALEERYIKFSNESLQSIKWRLETIVSIKSLRNIYKVVDEDQQKTARDYLSGVISTVKAILWEINNIQRQEKPKKFKTLDDLYNHWKNKYNQVEMSEISEILDRGIWLNLDIFMNKEIIMLDTNIIGKIINSSSKKDVVIRCQQWFRQILNNYLIYIPEIADYEVRRKLLHINSTKSIEMLEDLKQLEFVVYAPITAAIMLKAAELWAEARKKGQPTATEKELDGDVILAATAIIISKQEKKTVIIVTENRKHLQIYHPNTKHWEDEF